jgi:hypothetical protein
MKTIQAIQSEVGEWSAANFGRQDSKTETFVVEGQIEQFMVLGSLAPLLGIVEEVGELSQANHSNRRRDSEDAVGDILIYLCDFAYREQFELQLPQGWASTDMPPLQGLQIAVGNLCHCVLKHHQGIRDMGHPVVYANRRADCVHALLIHLHRYMKANHPSSNLLLAANETWNTVVSKRNWVADSEQGGGHTHEPGTVSVSDEDYEPPTPTEPASP